MFFHIFSPHESNFPPKTTFLEKTLGLTHVCHYSWNGQLGLHQNDCTFKKCTACLREGLIHEWKQALLAPPSPLMLVKKTHSSGPHTATVDILFLQHCSTNGKWAYLISGTERDGTGQSRKMRVPNFRDDGTITEILTCLNPGIT